MKAHSRTMTSCVVAAASVALAVSHASAHLLYEGFDYTAGSPLSSYSGTSNVGQVNPFGPTWQTAGSTSSTDFIQVGSPGLTGVGGTMPGVGNSINWGGDGDASRLPIGPFFAPVTGGATYFYSTSIQVVNAANLYDPTSATPPGAGNRGLVMGFNTVGPTQTGIPSVAGARIYLSLGSAPNTFRFGFSKNSNTAGQYVFETTDRPMFDADNNPITYFVVGSYTLANRGTLTDDEANLWVNPDSTTFGTSTPPAPTFATNNSSLAGPSSLKPTADGNDLSTNSIQSLLLIQKGPTGQTTGQVLDEIRVDSRWAGVTPVPGNTYAAAASGNWSTDSSWSAGAHPNAANATVNLPQAAAPVTLTLDAPKTVGTLNVNSSTPYTLAGAGLTFDTNATLNVSAGNHAITAPVTVATSLNADLATGSSVTLSSVTFASGATLTKAGAGVLSVPSLNADAVSILGTGSLKLTGPAASVVRKLSIPSITSPSATTLPPVGSLDLNATLAYDYSGSSPLTSSLADGSAPRVLDLLTYGYNGGAWTGVGIASSTAAADPKKVMAVGYAEASVLKGLTGTATATVDGATVDATTLILKLTKYGDVNLDGVINGDDFAALDRGFAQYSAGAIGAGAARWTDGDFNFDFKVDSADYALIDKAYGVQQGVLDPAFLAAREAEFGSDYVAALVAAVPEPTSLAACGFALLPMLTRRRRD